MKINRVRLSFPSLFRKAEFNGVETKYEATFLIPKEDTFAVELVKTAIENAAKAAKVKIPADKTCLKDGDDFDYNGYEDNWVLKASSDRRPLVVNRDKSPITEEDEIVYPGCYVNAVVSIWIQNNQFGKRANCNLEAVQYVKDGEPLGAKRSSGIEELDALD